MLYFVNIAVISKPCRDCMMLVTYSKILDNLSASVKVLGFVNVQRQHKNSFSILQKKSEEVRWVSHTTLWKQGVPRAVNLKVPDLKWFGTSGGFLQQVVSDHFQQNISGCL